jgi:hypothetical protein
VGADGVVLKRSAAGWQLEDTGVVTDRSLHSVWIDPTGSVWTVGGEITVPPLGRGLLIHKGDAIANTVEE